MNEIYRSSIFLMPFTPKSILVYYLLKNNGANVIGFIDNDEKLSSKYFDGIPIFSPDKAYDDEPNATVILSEVAYYYANYKQLHELGFNDVIEMYELSFDDDISNYASKLNSDFYSGLIPKQVPYGKQFVNVLSALKTWKELMSKLKDEFVKPYCFKDRYSSILSNNYNPNCLVLVNATGFLNDVYFGECMNNLSVQNCRFSPLFIYTYENEDIIKRKVKIFKPDNAIYLLSNNNMSNIETIEFVRKQFADYRKYDLIVTVGANDKFSNSTLAVFANEVNANKFSVVYTANEDRIYKNDYIAPYYKRDYQRNELTDAAGLLRNIICVQSGFNGDISELSLDDIYVVDEVLYHYRVLSDTVYDNKIKPIAYYLPQFHAIPENDEWWGKGFTEWTNVKRAVPMFEGHYWPRVPSDLGYYNLLEDKDIQKKQMDLARQYGIYGFCYYYYWFNGKRLLEKPLDNVLNNPELDMPFCICWANENWTRRWDGMENEILMEQKHNDDSDKRFIRDVLPILKDPRYITVNGAPILLIYRYDLFPDFKNTVSKWREVAAQNGIPNIHISIVKTVWYTQDKFNALGCDSESEFPPWRIVTPRITRTLKGLNPDFHGDIYDYKDYLYQSMNVRKEKQICFRGIMMGFDNTPRRMKNAKIFHGSSPGEYKKLLVSLVDFTAKQPAEERLIFINAWNEWSEGNHLEPDEKYGVSYLKATLEAIGINCQQNIKGDVSYE